MDITIRHTAATGTVMTGLVHDEDDASAGNIASGHGFRPHATKGFHIPKTAGQEPKEYVIEACAVTLRNYGHTVTVEYA